MATFLEQLFRCRFGPATSKPDNFITVSPNKAHGTIVCKNIARELGLTILNIESFIFEKRTKDHHAFVKLKSQNPQISLNKGNTREDFINDYGLELWNQLEGEVASFELKRQYKKHSIFKKDHVFDINPDVLSHQGFRSELKNLGVEIICLQIDDNQTVIDALNRNNLEKQDPNTQIDKKSKNIISIFEQYKFTKTTNINVTGLSAKWAAKKILNRDKMSESELGAPFYDGKKINYSCSKYR